jgi:flap endonuclease-1
VGVAITAILEKQPISLDDLRGKIIVVDAFNMLYQFLTTIRMPDGTPLKDSQGRVTSHLVGLFARTTNLMERGVKLAFVFDGKKPVLKRREVERRVAAKQDAAAKYSAAVESRDVEAMKKFAGRTVSLTPEMVEETKTLLRALGLPVIQAPSEAEAQASRYVREGHAFAVASQDADCLLFGCPRYIRNLSLSGRRKKPGTPLYITVEPELIDLQRNLALLRLTQQQLISLGMLVGTDFNPGGIKGIGPKKALKLVQEHPQKEILFATVQWDEHNLVPWQDVWEVLEHMPTDPPQNLEWGGVRRAEIEEMLRSRGFSEERFAILEKLRGRQQGLGEFFG